MNKNQTLRYFADLLSAEAGRMGKFKISMIGNPDATGDKYIARDYKDLLHKYILNKFKYYDIEFEEECKLITGGIGYMAEVAVNVNTIKEVKNYYRVKRVLKKDLEKRQGLYIFNITWEY